MNRTIKLKIGFYSLVFSIPFILINGFGELGGADIPLIKYLGYGLEQLDYLTLKNYPNVLTI